MYGSVTRARANLLVLAFVGTSILTTGCSDETGNRPPVAQASPSSSPSPSASPSASRTAEPSLSPAPESSPSTERTPEPPRTPRVRRVVVVSLDGFGTDVVESVGLEALPNLASLVDGGASTFNARTEVEQTVTLPNHTGMMTGRPVDPAVGGHGVDVNADRGRTVQALAGAPVRSVFDVVHDSGGTTALLATEDKFALFARSWPDAIDDFSSEQDRDAEVMTEAIAEVTEQQRTLTFVHLGLVDQIGHESGGSPASSRMPPGCWTGCSASSSVHSARPRSCGGAPPSSSPPTTVASGDSTTTPLTRGTTPCRSWCGAPVSTPGPISMP